VNVQQLNYGRCRDGSRRRYIAVSGIFHCRITQHWHFPSCSLGCENRQLGILVMFRFKYAILISAYRLKFWNVPQRTFPAGRSPDSAMWYHTVADDVRPAYTVDSLQSFAVFVRRLASAAQDAPISRMGTDQATNCAVVHGYLSIGVAVMSRSR